MDREKRNRLARLLLAQRPKSPKPDHSEQARKKPKTLKKVHQYRTVKSANVSKFTIAVPKSTEDATESPADLGYVVDGEEEKVTVDDRFVRKPKVEDSIEDDESKEYVAKKLAHVNMSKKHAWELWTECVWGERSRDGKIVIYRKYGQIDCVMNNAYYADAIYYLVSWMAAQKDDNLTVTCVTLHVNSTWLETKAVQSIVNRVRKLCKDPTVKVNCIDTPYNTKEWKTIVFARSA